MKAAGERKRREARRREKKRLSKFNITRVCAVIVSPQVWQLVSHICAGNPVVPTDSSGDHDHHGSAHDPYVHVTSIRTNQEQGSMCSLVVHRQQSHRNTLCTPTPAMEDAFKSFVPTPVCYCFVSFRFVYFCFAVLWAFFLQR